MQQQRQHLAIDLGVSMSAVTAQLVLLGARLAQHHRD
jgi:hypothetical protein